MDTGTIIILLVFVALLIAAWYLITQPALLAKGGLSIYQLTTGK